MSNTSTRSYLYETPFKTYISILVIYAIRVTNPLRDIVVGSYLAPAQARNQTGIASTMHTPTTKLWLGGQPLYQYRV